jgi:hypothetical protein
VAGWHLDGAGKSDYFGHVRIDDKIGVMTVSHRVLSGAVRHQTELVSEG